MYTNEEDLSEEEKCILAMFEPNVATALKYSEGDELLMGFLEEVTEASKGSIGEAYDKEWAVKEAGREEGIEQGIELKNLEIARNMLSLGYKSKEVSKYLNMSLEKLNELLEKNNKSN
jgi:predicted transposase/invertase (TIGR01784 family)